MKTIRYFGILQEQLLCARGSQEGAQRCRRDPSRHSPALCCPQAGPLGSSQHRETRDAPEEAKNGPKGQDQKSAAGDHQCFYTRANCGPCILDWPPSAQHRPKARSLPLPSPQGWTQPRARGHFRRLGGGVETFKPNINS